MQRQHFVHPPGSTPSSAKAPHEIVLSIAGHRQHPQHMLDAVALFSSFTTTATCNSWSHGRTTPYWNCKLSKHLRANKTHAQDSLPVGMGTHNAHSRSHVGLGKHIHEDSSSSRPPVGRRESEVKRTFGYMSASMVAGACLAMQRVTCVGFDACKGTPAQTSRQTTS